jgi:hypothetical protein
MSEPLSFEEWKKECVVVGAMGGGAESVPEAVQEVIDSILQKNYEDYLKEHDGEGVYVHIRDRMKQVASEGLVSKTDAEAEERYKSFEAMKTKFIKEIMPDSRYEPLLQVMMEGIVFFENLHRICSLKDTPNGLRDMLVGRSVTFIQYSVQTMLEGLDLKLTEAELEDFHTKCWEFLEQTKVLYDFNDEIHIRV